MEWSETTYYLLFLYNAREIVNCILLFTFFGFVILFWIFVVTKNWIKLTANAYAERLLESVNEL